MEALNWNEQATLYEFDGDRDADAARYLRGTPVATATLGQVVERVCAQPESEAWRYSITRNGPILTPEDIQAVAASRSFKMWRNAHG